MLNIRVFYLIRVWGANTYSLRLAQAYRRRLPGNGRQGLQGDTATTRSTDTNATYCCTIQQHEKNVIMATK